MRCVGGGGDGDTDPRIESSRQQRRVHEVAKSCDAFTEPSLLYSERGVYELGAKYVNVTPHFS